MMDTIGIMGAVPQEVELVVARLQGARREDYAGVSYHLGRTAGRAVVVCCAGMGKVNAAATTQVLITRYGAQAILFSGVGGNISSRAALGEVVIGQEVLYHDADADLIAQSPPHQTVFRSDPALMAAAEAGCKKAGVRCIRGRIATGDRFIGDPAVKADIEARCRPDCVEMEGAAVAQVATRNGLPFAVLRTMSDDASKSFEDVAVDIFDIDSYVAASSAIVLATLEALG